MAWELMRNARVELGTQVRQAIALLTVSDKERERERERKMSDVCTPIKSICAREEEKFKVHNDEDLVHVMEVFL